MRSVSIFVLSMLTIIIYTSCAIESNTDNEEDSVSSDEDTGNFDEYDADSADDDVDDDATAPDDDFVDDDDDTPGPLECMLEEGFEGGTFPPTGWMVKSTNPFFYFQWRQHYYAAYNGKSSAVVLSYVFGSDELLLTNMIDLSDYSDLSVTFWNFGAYTLFTGYFYPPELSVEVSHDINTWTPVWTFVDSDWTDMDVYTGDPYDLYKEVTVNLDEYAGENLYLGWRFRNLLFPNPAAYYWMVDDIIICGNLKE